MPRRLGNLLFLAVLLLCACPRRGPDRPKVLQYGPYRAVQLHDPELLGVSGLAIEGQDLLVVTEREHRFLRLRGDSEGAYQIVERKPVQGVKRHRDLESLARLGKGRYAIGTERDEERKRDRIQFFEESRAALTSTRTISLNVKELFGMRPKDNQGVEGLCSSAGYLVAAIETVKTNEAGERLAPIAVLGPGQSVFAPAWVRLLTDTGKLSALHCRKVEAGLDAIAIERHYGVMRVIRFLVPFAPEGEVLEAAVMRDLEDVYQKLGQPNFEGIERFDDGSLVLVSDNDHGGRDGPTVLLFVPAGS